MASKKHQQPPNSPIQSFLINSPKLIGYGVPIKVELRAGPGGRADFSIARVVSASRIAMSEDPASPGVYTGEYIARRGDRAQDTSITVIYTHKDGKVYSQEASAKISIETVPPVIDIKNISVDLGQKVKVIRNGASFTLRVKATPKSTVSADLSVVDSKQKRLVGIPENPRRLGTYRAQLTISSKNSAPNGVKFIRISIKDAYGNGGNSFDVPVELQNPEFKVLRGFDSADTILLQTESIYTLADLRRMDVNTIATKTGIDTDKLSRYQASARLLALDIQPDIVRSLVNAGYSGPAKLAITDIEKIRQGLAKDPTLARLWPNRDFRLVADEVQRKSWVVLGEMRRADLAEKVGSCEDECSPDESKLGCLAYLRDLISKTPFKTRGDLEKQFGWDIGAFPQRLVRCQKLCIDILKSLVKIKYSHPKQREYDEFRNVYLVGISQMTQSQLNQVFGGNPAYLTALRKKDHHAQNAILEAFLRTKGQPFEDQINQALIDLEPRELEALVAQSGKAAEEWSERYFISFSSDNCQETSYCELAILQLQAYLAKQAYGNSTQEKLPYLTYDEWRIEKSKELYPENFYAYEFKQPLIQGERELLKCHLKRARELLDTVRVSEQGRAPSADADESLLSSPRYRDLYYRKFETGISLIEDCVEVDDLMVQGHDAFFHKEYTLARIYYLKAGRLIRDISLKLSVALVLPQYLQDEPVLCDYPSAASSNVTSLQWSQSKQDNGWLLKKSRLEIRNCLSQYETNYRLAYAEANVTGIELPKGLISLKGTLSGGSFDYLINPLKFPEWVTKTYGKNFVETVPAPWYTIPPNYTLGSPFGDRSFTDRLIYLPSLQWTDYIVEVDLGTSSKDPNCGILFRSATAGIWRNPLTKNGEFFINEKDEPFELGENPPAFRIRLELRGKTIRAKLYTNNYEPDIWELAKTIPSNETEFLPLNSIPDHGFFGLFSVRRETSHGFTRMRAWDTSNARGAISDLAFLIYSIPIGNRFHTSDYTERFAASLDSLPSIISIGYHGGNQGIVREDVPYEQVYKFYENNIESGLGLWYQAGEDRLDRDNLRWLLDQLTRLFIHQYFFLLPICLGDVANELAQYEEALYWYRIVYDERWQDNWDKPVYLYLNRAIEGPMMAHRIAENYLDWADSLFQENTQESIQEARRKYKLALATLEDEKCCDLELDKRLNDVTLQFLNLDLSAAEALGIWRRMEDVSIVNRETAEVLFQNVEQTLKRFRNPQSLVRALQDSVSDAEQRLAAKPNKPLLRDDQDILKDLKTLEDQYSSIFDNLEIEARLHQSYLTSATTGSDDSTPKNLIISALNTRNLENLEHAKIKALPANTTFDQMLDLAIESPLPIWDEVLSSSRYPTMYRGEFQFWYEAEKINTSTIDLCTPPNPRTQSLVQRACYGIYLIDHCFNILGFPQNEVSIYRFEYLLNMAKNFVNLALAAEKEFIQFKDRFEADSLELINAAQAITLAQAGTRLADLRLQEAFDQVAIAYHQVIGVNAQIGQVERRIEQLGSPWAVLGVVFGAIAAAVGSVFTFGATGVAYTAGTLAVGIGVGVATGTAGGMSYQAGLEDNEESLRMQLQHLRTVDLPAARLNRELTIDQRATAQQQIRIAQLEAQFTAERVTFLEDQFFNPQLWSFLAREIKKHYQVYLRYASISAWLAQRALEFERGIEPKRRFANTWPETDRTDTSLNIIRFDYYQPAQQGLLAADALMSDITTLEQEKLITEQRKLKIPKVISLAQTQPLAFIDFLETGQLYFNTQMEDFDFDYPGHYQRRIKEVRVNVFGLIGPEGIKATLTHLGPSEVVVKEWDSSKKEEVFSAKTLRHPMAVAALTNPQPGGINKVTLTPDESELKPFEGKGVAGAWVLEMPKASNQIDYATITDIQFVVEYTAFFDARYQKQVVDRLPKTRTGIRAYSFCLEFSDACLYLHDSTRPIGMIETNDKTMGAYTLKLETRATDFPPNQQDRQLIEAIVYFHPRGKKDYSMLKAYLSCGQLLSPLTEADLVAFTTPTTEPDTIPILLKSNPPNYIPESYLGRVEVSTLQVSKISGVVDTWYLYIPPDDPANAPFLAKDQKGNLKIVNGHNVFDFSDVQDVIFALHYKYGVPPFPPQ